MGDKASKSLRILKREGSLFIGLLFVGFVLMPIAIYVVGQSVFGSYGGSGYGHFFSTLSGKVRTGDSVAWFLILSPYLIWQVLRLMMYAWRLTTPGQNQPTP